MTVPPAAEDPGAADEPRQEGVARTGGASLRVDRARIDEVFGETLPETTSDERRARDSRIDDDWWREQRPPHHG